MRTARFFVPAEWIATTAGAFCISAGSLHRQITTVLRLKIGDHISLLIDDGKELDCLITDITRSAIMGSVEKTSRHQAPAKPAVTVCIAMTKRDHFEIALQKCTELGATRFIPVLAERVIKKPKDIPKRWLDIVREAAEQSGRTTLPSITEPLSLTETLVYTEACVRIFFHETGGSKLPKLHATSCVAIFIGPEGGWTEAELNLAKNAKAHLVTLGDLVLRAETAAIVGTALLRFS